VTATPVGAAETVLPFEKDPRKTMVFRMTWRTTGAMITLGFGARVRAAASAGDCTHWAAYTPPADSTAAEHAATAVQRRRRASREPATAPPGSSGGFTSVDSSRTGETFARFTKTLLRR
jgi:hypothetical protein